MQGQRKELRDEEEEVLSGSSGRGSHPYYLCVALNLHRAVWGLQDFLLEFSSHLMLFRRLE